MRFIIHEMSYEKPTASGRWVYQKNGQRTGAVENWRMTDALDGYRFLRVDLDARQAESGRSYIYHLVIDAEGNPVQLKFRLWQGELEITGTLLFDEETIIVTRETKHERFEAVLTAPDNYVFWFPAATSLGYQAGKLENKAEHVLTFRTDSDKPETLMAAIITPVDIARGTSEEIDIMGKSHNLTATSFAWLDQKRSIWLDDKNQPWKMERGDGLSAVETRHILYQRITRPGQSQTA